MLIPIDFSSKTLFQGHRTLRDFRNSFDALYVNKENIHLLPDEQCVCFVKDYAYIFSGTSISGVRFDT
jgi:hypothetical protein